MRSPVLNESDNWTDVISGSRLFEPGGAHVVFFVFSMGIELFLFFR